MYKILLVSDTHGTLDIINEKTLQVNADLVIRAGDFGFYDEQSILRLIPRKSLGYIASIWCSLQNDQ